MDLLTAVRTDVVTVCLYRDFWLVRSSHVHVSLSLYLFLFTFHTVKHEIHYTTGMLQYIVARLSSAPSVESSTKSMDLQDTLGAFMDLNCGHNNPFSHDEKRQLTELLIKATSETRN